MRRLATWSRGSNLRSPSSVAALIATTSACVSSSRSAQLTQRRGITSMFHKSRACFIASRSSVGDGRRVPKDATDSSVPSSASTTIEGNGKLLIKQLLDDEENMALLVEQLRQRGMNFDPPTGSSSPATTASHDDGGSHHHHQRDGAGLPHHVLRSTVKIFASSSLPNCIIPWQMRQQIAVSGSGFVVDKARRLIITNAHVVLGAPFVEVRKHGDSNNHTGFVVFVGADCDLALVHIPDHRFWSEESLVALPFDLPASNGSASAGATQDGKSKTATATAPAAPASNPRQQQPQPPSMSGGTTSPLDALADMHAQYDAFGGLPKLQAGVKVVGYPVGGDQLSITSGVVSRIEVSSYGRDTFAAMLTVQIDAAINHGNSGGPAINTQTNAVIGIAFQVLGNAESIGYIIPLPIVAAFLYGFRQSSVFRDVLEPQLQNAAAAALASAAGEFPPAEAASTTKPQATQPPIPSISSTTREYFPHAPTIGIHYQVLLNKNLRAFFKMPEQQTGIAVSLIGYQSASDGVLRERDVVVAINGYPIENDGTVEFRSHERVSYTHLVHVCPPGSSVQLSILRDGALMEVDVAPTSRPTLVQQHLLTNEFREKPKYCMFGGLVFSTLTNTLLAEWGDQWYNNAPRWLVQKLADRITADLEEVVVVVQVIPHPVNQSYDFMYGRIVSHVGGVSIKNFEQFKTLLRACHQHAADHPEAPGDLTDPREVLVLNGVANTSAATTEVVFPIREAILADKEIATTCQLPPQQW